MKHENTCLLDMPYPTERLQTIAIPKIAQQPVSGGYGRPIVIGNVPPMSMLLAASMRTAKKPTTVTVLSAPLCESL